MRKVKLTIESANCEVGDWVYRFYNESDLETLIAAYVDEDDNAREEIEDCGMVSDYCMDVLWGRPAPEGLPFNSIEYHSVRLDDLFKVEAEVDGEVVLSKEYSYSSPDKWLEEVLEEKKNDAVPETEDFLQPVKDLIKEKKFEKIYATQEVSGDYIEVKLVYEFEIEGDFDFGKFHFLNSSINEDSFNANKAIYDGQIITGEDEGEHSTDHTDLYLSIFNDEGEEEIELESY